MTVSSHPKVVAAVIGAGFMGDVHSRALRAAGIAISGVLSSTQEKSLLAAQTLGLDRAYRDLDELLADPSVTVVHVLTPNSTHSELVTRALEAGKHVVCEKPLAISSAEASAMAMSAKRLGLVAAVPFVYRYHPMAREAKSRIQAGNLGRLLSVKGEYLQDWLLDPGDTNWRVGASSGGPSRAFADIGVHLCDLIEFISGQQILKLIAKTQTVYPSRVGSPVTTEDLALVMAELDGGGLVSLMVSQVAAGHKNGLVVELHGTSQTLRFEQEDPEKLWVGLKEGSRVDVRNPALLSPEASRLTSLPAGHPEGYFDAFVSFMRDVRQAILGQTPDDLPGFSDGVRAAVLTESVIRSASTGAWVDVPARIV